MFHDDAHGVPLPHRAFYSSGKPSPWPPRTSYVSMTPKTNQIRRSSSSTASAGNNQKKPQMDEARPSSSVILLSPTNQVLLLHRVQTSTSFPSAHVFPGGNLSSFHEPPLSPPPPPGGLSDPGPDLDRHRDSPAYRLAAIRETFEESGILLARRGDEAEPALLSIPEAERDKAREEIHNDRLHFQDWAGNTLKATLCVDELVPFTRWVTPPNMPKRFTTQMYLFLMPLHHPVAGTTGTGTGTGASTGATGPAVVDVDVVQTPTTDGGIEHTAATFADASEWLRRQRDGEIVLFPPQCYLLSLVAGVMGSAAVREGEGRYAAQRRALLDFVGRTPTSGGEVGSEGLRGVRKIHPTAMIPWSEKVMSPQTLFIRKSDGRIVLGVDKPGPELKGTGRGGDFDRVVLVKFTKQGPKEVEVRDREDVLREEKVAARL
ncbi:hypothetical protein SLS53_003621 [Cytospora paraplurivora]|uniref:Nudix hydrolase domain-containing protein n=1 Tax=Cytospora paraplurivora TaxID=2898453 RepID=A0AAN9UD02_9PEZI